MKQKEEEDYRTYTKSHWFLLFIILFGAAFLVNNGTQFLHTNVLTTNSPAPYDGTTLPILKVAKWTSLSSGEWDLGYDELSSKNKLDSLPVYNANQLKTPTEQLGWSLESDLNIRNAKITFSIPYMGNYKLDGIENSGSHLAVDLKLPMNTPVYAIGNGVVTKVSEQSTGFGNHIVIKHVNFPSYSSSSSKETLYSSYSHLALVNVSEGDIVTKGQFIGKSGETGTATTPHLHFQIDNSNAPWHPYWPFTYAEASEAGYSFSEAVNAGLGKEKALQTTVNPMMYVQKYMSGSTSSTNTTTTTSSSNTSSSTSTTPDTFDLPPVVDNETDTTAVENDIEIVNEKPAVEFEVTHDGSFVINSVENIKVRALDEDGTLVRGYKPDQAVYVQVILGAADITDTLFPEDIVDGTTVFNITPTSNSALQIKVSDGEISGESEVMASDLFDDVNSESESYKAISFLKDHNVIGGYPDGTFKPDDVVSRVEALKFILNGVNANLISSRELPFPDTSAKEWYSNYVATAYNRQIVDGYPDSTFKPANTVNKAEFLKMLLTAMDVELDGNINDDVYADVQKDAWFAPYVKYAKDRNLLIISNNQYHPEEGMTRREVAELIYRTILLKISGAPKYSSGIRLSTGDLSTYFS